jgi:hypothetical protein
MVKPSGKKVSQKSKTGENYFRKESVVKKKSSKPVSNDTFRPVLVFYILKAKVLSISK